MTTMNKPILDPSRMKGIQSSLLLTATKVRLYLLCKKKKKELRKD